MEVDADIEGDVLSFSCPVCQEDHHGLIVIRTNGECPLCHGKGSISRPAYGTATVEIDPPEPNEGWL